MRKSLWGLLLLPVLLAGCTTVKANEQDYLNQLKNVYPLYYNNITLSTLLDRGYGACHMLQGGIAETEVRKQIPEKSTDDIWNHEVTWAKAFLCPALKGK
jgi:hypothetical protein